MKPSHVLPPAPVPPQPPANGKLPSCSGSRGDLTQVGMLCSPSLYWTDGFPPPPPFKKVVSKIHKNREKNLTNPWIYHLSANIINQWPVLSHLYP